MPSLTAISWVAPALVLLAALPAPEPGSASDYPEEVRPLHSAAVEDLRSKLEQEFRGQLDPDAVALADELGCAAWALGGSNEEYARKALKTALEKLAALQVRHPEDERVMLAVLLEIMDEAPADAAEITKISGEAQDLLGRGMIFPARASLGRLASEIRIRTSDISLPEIAELMREAQKELDAAQIEAATRRLSEWRMLVRRSDYVAPIPVESALAAIDAAEQAGTNHERLRQSLAAAEAGTKRAVDLGYLDPRALQPPATERLTHLREAIERGSGATEEFGAIREALGQFRLLPANP